MMARLRPPAAVVALALMLPGQTAIADAFTPPQGCEAYLTVHSLQCDIVHHYTCVALPGHRWAMLIREDGPAFLSHIDAEAQWVESIALPEGIHDVTLPDPADPQSMTALLETGYDSWDITEQRQSGRVVRYQGFDQLTGTEVEIDGEPLLETRFGYRAIDAATGRLLDAVVGQEYVSRLHRRFFSGTRTFSTREGEVTVQNPPVRFLYPGEDGFLSNTPPLNCGAIMSALPQSRSAS